MHINFKKFFRVLSNKELYFHLLFWMFYFAAINVNWTDNWFDKSLRPNHISQFSVLLFPSFFYFNAFWSIPKYLKKRRWLPYILITSFAITGIECIRITLYVLFYPTVEISISTFINEFNSDDNIIIGRLNPIFMCLQFSFAFRFTRDWVLNNSLIDQLKTEKLRMELAFLKAQVNPHFLFNTLNVLDDLIGRDSNRAKEYLNKLSKMYRYSITNLNKDVISLQEEWNFVDDYIYLIKERYGSAYQFKKKNNLEEIHRYIIPPASLQSLIENAVKHNQGSMDRPLLISIVACQEGISVCHIKNPKIGAGDNLGTGLENLKSRFKSLSDMEVTINDSKSFRVTLPLIPKSS